MVQRVTVGGLPPVPFDALSHLAPQLSDFFIGPLRAKIGRFPR
jgi:hypothetical protein